MSSCQNDDSLSGLNNEQKNLAIIEAQEFFEKTVAEAASRGSLVQNRSWSPGEVVPRWESAFIKKNEQYSYMYVPIYAQNRYIGTQRAMKNGAEHIYHVNVSQLLCIRKNTDGKYSAAYITLLPSKGYYTANKNDVMANFMKKEGPNGDFSGRVIYNDLTTFRLLAIDKVNDGVFEWGFSPETVADKQEFNDSYHKMFKKLSILKATGISTRGSMDGGNLEEVAATFCTRCQQQVDNSHSCSKEEEEDSWDPWEGHQEIGGNSDGYETDSNGWNSGGSGGTGGSGGGGNNSGGDPIIASSPHVRNIFINVNLTLDGIKRLNEALSDLLSHPEYLKLYNHITSKGLKMAQVRIGSEVDHGGYRASDKTMIFNNVNAIKGAFNEEFIHFCQDALYPGGITSYLGVGRANIEFEAKLIQDIVCRNKEVAACSMYGAGAKYADQYTDWILEITKEGTYVPKYSDLLSRSPKYDNLNYWDFMTDFTKDPGRPDYNDPINPNLQPHLLDILNKFQ